MHIQLYSVDQSQQEPPVVCVALYLWGGKLALRLLQAKEEAHSTGHISKNVAIADQFRFVSTFGVVVSYSFVYIIWR